MAGKKDNQRADKDHDCAFFIMAQLADPDSRRKYDKRRDLKRPSSQIRKLFHLLSFH